MPGLQGDKQCYIRLFTLPFLPWLALPWCTTCLQALAPGHNQQPEAGYCIEWAAWRTNLPVTFRPGCTVRTYASGFSCCTRTACRAPTRASTRWYGACHDSNQEHIEFNHSDDMCYGALQSRLLLTGSCHILGKSSLGPVTRIRRRNHFPHGQWTLLLVVPAAFWCRTLTILVPGLQGYLHVASCK